MKELSIEQKAKRYDEAIETAIKINSGEGVAAPSDWTICEVIFPELKESEDERIRKVLLNDFKNNCSEYYCEGVNRDMIIAWLEKQGEQKPTDKVEPKFKVGDWVVYDGWICQIIDVTEDGYCNSQHGFIPQNREDSMHLWTIQDAKDGDVLAIDPWCDFPSSFVAIYKKQNEEDFDNFDSYCFVGFDGKFYENEDGHSSEDIHPATKEQRDFLFQKMKESGYEWDADKKELKKIEQKSWSEEDKNRINRLIAYFEDKESFTAEDDIVYANWLKSLRPQNRWKPSDEQLTWLYRAADDANKDSRMKQVLNELLSDLRKLREE